MISWLKKKYLKYIIAVSCLLRDELHSIHLFTLILSFFFTEQSSVNEKCMEKKEKCAFLRKKLRKYDNILKFNAEALVFR